MMALRGEWSSLNLFDKLQLGTVLAGFCGITYAASPEMELLEDIRDRLGPAMVAEDVAYVSATTHESGLTTVEVRKQASEEPVGYQLWLCGGPHGTLMHFFGEGRFGRESTSVSLDAAVGEPPGTVLLKLETADGQFARAERWDIYRGIKESDTRIIKGETNCGEF